MFLRANFVQKNIKKNGKKTFWAEKNFWAFALVTAKKKKRWLGLVAGGSPPEIPPTIDAVQPLSPRRGGFKF